MAEAQNRGKLDTYEDAVDQAIAACGGDLRGAVKALLIANELLESELEALSVKVSQGYARGQIGARRRGGER